MRIDVHVTVASSAVKSTATSPRRAYCATSNRASPPVRSTCHARSGLLPKACSIWSVSGPGHATGTDQHTDRELVSCSARRSRIRALGPLSGRAGGRSGRPAMRVTQWELVRERAAAGGTAQLTEQWWPWYEFTLDMRLRTTSFALRPNVDGGTLVVDRRNAARSAASGGGLTASVSPTQGSRGQRLSGRPPSGSTPGCGSALELSRPERAEQGWKRAQRHTAWRGAQAARVERDVA